MRDIYTESIVSISSKPIFRVLKLVLTVLAALSLIATVYIGIVFIVVLILSVYFLYKVMQKTDGEYEYIHTNHCFDVDLVISNSRRKQLISIDLNQVTLVAKLDSDEMARFKNLPEKDYTGNNAGSMIYAMVYVDSGIRKKLLLQLNSNMYQSLKQWMPEKVR